MKSTPRLNTRDHEPRRADQCNLHTVHVIANKNKSPIEKVSVLKWAPRSPATAARFDRHLTIGKGPGLIKPSVCQKPNQKQQHKLQLAMLPTEHFKKTEDIARTVGNVLRMADRLGANSDREHAPLEPLIHFSTPHPRLREWECGG